MIRNNQDIRNIIDIIKYKYLRRNVSISIDLKMDKRKLKFCEFVASFFLK